MTSYFCSNVGQDSRRGSSKVGEKHAYSNLWTEMFHVLCCFQCMGRCHAGTLFP